MREKKGIVVGITEGEKMEPIEFIAIVASVSSIVSFCFNIVQWRRSTELIKALKSRSQAAYNYFFQIAQRSDTIRGLSESSDPEDKKVQIAIGAANRITGIADAARNDVISYSREHLNFVPLEEHPASPILDPLPKPGRADINNLRRGPHVYGESPSKNNP